MQWLKPSEDNRYADYVFLCGVMWTQYASEDACLELVRALDSKDPDVALLACALLEKKIASA
jgi:hypothetical protein